MSSGQLKVLVKYLGDSQFLRRIPCLRWYTSHSHVLSYLITRCIRVLGNHSLSHTHLNRMTFREHALVGNLVIKIVPPRIYFQGVLCVGFHLNFFSIALRWSV